MIPSYELSDLGPFGAELGDGRQGTVYALERDSSLVFKRYKNADQIDESALSMLFDWYTLHKTLDYNFLQERTAWPCGLVREKKRAIGVLMPKVPEHFTYLRPDGIRALNTLSHAISQKLNSMPYENLIPDEFLRLWLAFELCKLLTLFEQNDLLLLDLSSSNILWTLNPKLRIYLIDCDNIFFLNRSYPAYPLRTPNWHEPWFKNPPAPYEVRGLFALIFARLVFARKYANIESRLVLPPEHPYAKHFQDLVTAGYSENLSRRPSLDMWRRRIEKVFQQERKAYNSSVSSILSEAEPESQESFLKRFGKAYIKELSHPLKLFQRPGKSS